MLAPALALCSTSCGGVGPGSPPEFRLQPVAYPAIPEATTPCRHDPARLCNTDAETAGVLAGYDAALGEANLRLCYLRVYYRYPRCDSD